MDSLLEAIFERESTKMSDLYPVLKSRRGSGWFEAVRNKLRAFVKFCQGDQGELATASSPFPELPKGLAPEQETQFVVVLEELKHIVGYNELLFTRTAPLALQLPNLATLQDLLVNVYSVLGREDELWKEAKVQFACMVAGKTFSAQELIVSTHKALMEADDKYSDHPGSLGKALMIEAGRLLKAAIGEGHEDFVTVVKAELGVYLRGLNLFCVDQAIEESWYE